MYIMFNIFNNLLNKIIDFLFKVLIFNELNLIQVYFNLRF